MPFSLLVLSLPPGSQGAIRDVAEAYRNIPVHHSQWAGMVVHLSNAEDSFAIDTQTYFGGTANGGIYGHVADAGTDIMRAQGIGPISKWVDDHVFFRILREHLHKYNEKRIAKRESIQQHGGKIHTGGRIWYCAGTLPDDHPEEFNEDLFFPIQDLSSKSAQSAEDAKYAYNLDDINKISNALGIPWEASKDIPWSTTILFTGFE